jgi:hypothetical protein
MVARRERTAGSENITPVVWLGRPVFMQAACITTPKGGIMRAEERERNMAWETEMGVFVSELLDFYLIGGMYMADTKLQCREVFDQNYLCSFDV